MCDRPYLVTTCTFKGKDYICKMNVISRNTLELRILEKVTSEEWHCSYDATYIESLTRKTGNFKQFDIFATMLKSGLLKTSDAVILDLLTFDDLEALRSRRMAGKNFVPQASHLLPANSNNRRYLILTYTVEFDRIHYPLPLEYCGPPDPHILQGTIKRLEQDIANLQDQLFRSESNNRGEVIEQISALEKRLVEVTNENQILMKEVNRLTRLVSGKQVAQRQVDILQGTVHILEEKIKCERASLINLVKQLRQEKRHLLIQLEEAEKVVKYFRSCNNLVQETSQSNLLLKQRRDVTTRPRPRNISPFNNNLQQSVDRKCLKATRSEGFMGRNFNYKSQNVGSNSSDSSVGNHDIGKTIFKRNTNIMATAARHRSTSGNSQNSGKNKHSPNRTNLLNNLQRRTGRSPSACSSASSHQSQKQNPKLTKRRIHKSRREFKTGMSDLEERVQALQHVLRCGLSFT